MKEAETVIYLMISMLQLFINIQFSTSFNSLK